jgi:hypothetical protein
MGGFTSSASHRHIEPASFCTCVIREWFRALGRWRSRMRSAAEQKSGVR